MASLLAHNKLLIVNLYSTYIERMSQLLELIVYLRIFCYDDVTILLLQ